MDLNREDYAFRDSVFFEHPTHVGADRDPGVFEIAVPSTGWELRHGSDWTYVSRIGRDLPPQGWKVHVSATLGNAQEILDRCSAVLFELDVEFKFVPSRDLLFQRNAKYADRSSSGKFLTVYPADDEALEQAVNRLDAAVGGMRGPFILTDLRWKSGPVFLRYGAFTFREILDEHGRVVPAISEPDGTLVIDNRSPVFTLPSFASRPPFLRTLIEARLRTDAPDDEAFPYRVTEALHFSNGGGVYVAEPTDSPGRRVVLKEARPYAGVDPGGLAAVQRLEHEAWALGRLRDVAEVPTLHDRFTAWEHSFLVQDYVRSTTLYQWVAVNYPFPRSMGTADYTRRALAILVQLRQAIERVHDRGIAIRDVQPRNVLVDDDDRVHLIDFETASETTEAHRAAFGTPGFVPLVDCDAVSTDRYGLSRIAMHLFSPVTPLSHLHPEIWHRQMQFVEREFPPQAAALLREFDREAAVPPAEFETSHRPLAMTWSRSDVEVGEAIDALARGLASVRRADDPQHRLYPGDPTQFFGHGVLDLHSGTAGVLLMRARAGADCRDDIDWLTDRALRSSELGPGLLTGRTGIACALVEAGEISAALELLAADRAGSRDSTDLSLFSGAAGTALGLLSMAHAVDALREAAAWQPWINGLVDALSTERPMPANRRATNQRPVGIMDGWSGPALALIAHAEFTGSTASLDLAVRAIRRDLAHCVEAPDGSLQVDDVIRMMPYLDEGSAGIGVAIAALPEHARPDDLADALARIALACTARSYANAGLFSGRAGLIAALTAFAPETGSSTVPSLRTALDDQVRDLWLHAFTADDNEGVNFAGLHSLKLSTDYFSGTAGVLGALLAVRDDPTRWLPIAHPSFLFPSLAARGRRRHDRQRGGES